MKLLIIPFNDFKKGEQQGFRDRDNHFLEYILSVSETFEKILIVDRPISLLETIVKRNCWHVISGKVIHQGHNWKLTCINNNSYILNYMEVSIIKPALLRRGWWNSAYNSQAFVRIVNRILTELSFDDYTILLFHPFGMGLVEKLSSKDLCFDAIDNFLKIEHFAHLVPQTQLQYKDILLKARKIITVSKEAKKNLFNNHEKVSVISNGVYPEHFMPPFPEHNISLLRNSQKLKLGYVGTLADRINVKLLQKVSKFPEIEIFLVGPIVSRSFFSNLAPYKNIIFVENVHYSQVPSILRDFDVCMIPHRLGRHENDGDVMKLYEYIAANKPVISTGIQGSEKFGTYIYIANNEHEFGNALNILIKKNFMVNYPNFILNGMTWRDKTDELISLLIGDDHA